MYTKRTNRLTQERNCVMARTSFVFLVVGAVIFFIALASADIPHMISYQGKLTTASGGCLNDTVQMTFSIYPDTLGSPADWSETQMQVVVQEGMFNVLLGAVDTIPKAVFDGSVKYLGVQVESDPEMRPLKPMVSVAYAYRAASADGGGGWVDDGAVVRLETGTDSVAVGTTTPLGKLHVAADGLYSGYFTSDYVSNQTHVIHAEYTGTAPGVAVYGESTPLDGSGRGGYFVGSSSGLLGKVEPTGSDTYYGVIGSVSNLGGSSGINHGVHALADAGGTNYGVYALAYGDGAEMTYGIYSYANNSSTGDCYGGYLVADDEGNGTDSHVGVRANGYTTADQTAYGVQGYAENTGNGTVRGGYFQANSPGTGTHYGVVGNEAAGGSGAAVYAAGDFAGSGAKYAVVKTGKGHRLLGCMESPEIWFEDFGEGRLENGKAHIELDPLFLETVTINADHPMKVFVQLKDDCRGTYVKTWDTGFDVHELQGGISSASFSYRIVAKRKGYENERMRETDVGYDDPTLYPELQAEIDKAYQEETQQQQLQREKRRQEDERRKEEQRQMEDEPLR